MPVAPLDEPAAPEPERASGFGGIAGPPQVFEERGVLEALGAGERLRHDVLQSRPNSIRIPNIARLPWDPGQWGAGLKAAQPDRPTTPTMPRSDREPRRPVIVFGQAKRHIDGMTKIADHDAYIAAAPEQFRALLGQLRGQLARALPDAEEVIKYDMPGFQIEDTVVAGYAAFSKQCGLYVDPRTIAAHADEIAALKLKATKTGVTFSVNQPIPGELIEKLAADSRTEKGR